MTMMMAIPFPNWIQLGGYFGPVPRTTGVDKQQVEVPPPLKPKSMRPKIDKMKKPKISESAKELGRKLATKKE